MNPNNNNENLENNKENIQILNNMIPKLNLNSKLIKKIKDSSKELNDIKIPFDYIKNSRRLTTSADKNQKIFDNSKTHKISKINVFNNLNLSNINNIKRIYFRYKNFLSTEMDYKNYKKLNNKFYGKKNNKALIYNNIKNKNNKSIYNNGLRKVLEPINEIYIPLNHITYENIYNNYMTNRKKITHMKYRHSTPIQFLTNRKYKNNVKKLKSSNSNDHIQFNNNNHKISLYNYNYMNNNNNNSYVFRSPLTKKNKSIFFKEEQNNHLPQKYINMDKKNPIINYPRKEIQLTENNETNYRDYHRKLSLKKNFGDNYKYFERNESPLKDNKTFHFRRSPVHVYGYENYLIIEDSNHNLVGSPIKNKQKMKKNNDI